MVWGFFAALLLQDLTIHTVTDGTMESALCLKILQQDNNLKLTNLNFKGEVHAGKPRFVAELNKILHSVVQDSRLLQILNCSYCPG